MEASQGQIEEFLSGPLVKWLSTCVKKPELLQVYETFFDGSSIKEVLYLIDPEPSQPIPSLCDLQGHSTVASRIKIFHFIFRNIKTIYEELGQIVTCLPDCVTLGTNPRSQVALNQLKVLILLLLGCAVQGPSKQLFITRIKELSLEDQHSIVECIKQITDEQSLVLGLDCTDQPERLIVHVKTLTEEHDKILQQWLSNMGLESVGSSIPFSNEVESNHLAVELADWKARLRKLRQELEEKSEILAECKEEMKHTNNLVVKLKNENCDLLAEARQAKIYRDEVDSMRERLERAEKLEIEVQRYRERLADVEYYKTRVEELREDNKVLHETREMLEAQVVTARLRSDHVLELEAELLASKQTISDVTLERDAARMKIQELIDENIHLQQKAKSVVHEIMAANDFSDEEIGIGNSEGHILSEQLTSRAQAKALRLELENKKLLLTIDSLKENSLHNNADKMFDIKKENKQLLLKCEQFQENIDRLNQQKSELECLLGNAIKENQKYQEKLKSEKVTYDRQNNELQSERNRSSELKNNIELLAKEKVKLQILCDTLKKRSEDMEKTSNQVTTQLESLQIQANKTKEHEVLNIEMQEKVNILEKENSVLQKDISKIKETIESKDVKLDVVMEENNKLVKDNSKLTNETKELNKQLEKLHEFEHKIKELTLQSSISSETIETLQKDLISEKVLNEKIRTNLDKLGLNIEILDNDINLILPEIMKMPEIVHHLVSLIESQSNVKSEKFTSVNSENDESKKLHADIANLQIINDTLQNDNATVKVDLSTLKSQLNSLQTQQTALQFANSQLVAEKDELLKKIQIQSTQHDTLLLDQIMLRSIHEQLNLEYEESRKDQEYLKKVARDLRFEMRTLLEKINSLENNIMTLETEKEALKNTTTNLLNLRAEHSKLKEDFRNLFTASEHIKQEYELSQKELKTLRIESRSLMLGQTEMQGELNSRSDRMANLQLDNTKLQQKCDMLFEMNHSLDSDRKALMDHVSQLLTQYHSLLTHSLEDKQQFHIEEKLYTDKLNNLCRQKEKLEEKIMEHYRKLENASCKKKSFGANLVRRVRKAGSDMLNKVPKHRKSWHEESTLCIQSLSGDSSVDSNGNNSDNSIEYLNQQQSQIESGDSNNFIEVKSTTSKGGNVCVKEEASSVSLGSVGSRRTVYLSEDNMCSPTTTPFQENQESNNLNPPMLIYNRISTAFGGISSTPVKPDEEKQSNSNNPFPKPRSAEETAIWYEYGCV